MNLVLLEDLGKVIPLTYFFCVESLFGLIMLSEDVAALKEYEFQEVLPGSLIFSQMIALFLQRHLSKEK